MKYFILIYFEKILCTFVKTDSHDFETILFELKAILPLLPSTGRINSMQLQYHCCWKELRKAIKEIIKNLEIKSAIITGSGEKSLCSRSRLPGFKIWMPYRPMNFQERPGAFWQDRKQPKTYCCCCKWFCIGVVANWLWPAISGWQVQCKIWATRKFGINSGLWRHPTINSIIGREELWKWCLQATWLTCLYRIQLRTGEPCWPGSARICWKQNPSWALSIQRPH